MKRLEDLSSNVDFRQKGADVDRKRPKKGGTRFFQTVNLNFLKEDHYTSFYTKNQQSSMKRLEQVQK